MPPYHNLPELLRPINPPHHPDHHRHDGHDHPHPQPSFRITSIALALLSTYIFLLVVLAIFTLWRLNRKRQRAEVECVIAPSRDDESREFGYGGRKGGGLLAPKTGMVRSRESREREGSGGGSGIPNTHLSHEDIDDDESTTLLPQGGSE